MIVTPENIDSLFDNPINKKEGFGVFLVVSVAGQSRLDRPPRLELCKIDSMDTFATDFHARKYFMDKVREGGNDPRTNRYLRILKEIELVDPMAARQIDTLNPI